MNITNKVDGFYRKGDIVEWTDWSLRSGYGKKTFGRLLGATTRWRENARFENVFLIHVTDEFHPFYDIVIDVPRGWGINHKRSK